MKKLALLLTAVVFIIGLTACGGGDTPEKLIGEMLDVMDGFATDMDKVGSADDVVAAIDKFAAGMKDLKPRMEALEEKYPELKQMQGDKFPEKYKQFEDRFKEVTMKIAGSMGKMMQYASDPKVVEAQQKLQEAMK